MTGQDLIAAALRRIGALGQGELPNGSETLDAQLVLNSMIDSWNTDRGNLYTLGLIQGGLQPSKQTYTLGPAGDFPVTVRPVRIQTVGVTFGAYRWPIDLIGADQWSAKVQRAAANTVPYQLFSEYGMNGSKLDGARWAALLLSSPLAALPWQLYCDYGSPSANLNFWPVPGAAGISLDLQVWQVLAQINNLALDLTKDLFLPPGYVEALRLNLALKLCEEWGLAVPPGLPPDASQALAAMRAINTRNQQLIEGQETAGAIPVPTAAPAPPPAQ